MFDEPPVVKHLFLVTRTESQLVSILTPKGATPTTTEIYDKARGGNWVSTIFKVDPLSEEDVDGKTADKG